MSPAPRANSTANASKSFNSSLLGDTRASSFGFPSLGQLVGTLIEFYLARHHQHGKLINQISDFPNHLFRIIFLPRDDRFGGFLANLFKFLVEAFVKKITRVRPRRSLASATLDQI